MYFKHGLNIRYFQKRGYRQMIYNKIFPTVHEKDTQVASLNNNLEEDETVIYAKDIFYKCLKKHNVTNAFIYSGGSIMPLIDTLYNGDIKYYVNSHEQNCGHALTGFSKSNINHDEKAIVMTTSGPGFTNLITPMLDATNDSTPSVFITGQVPLNAVGTNAFQEAPSIKLSKHVTKYSEQIKSIMDIEPVLDKAFEIAYSGKMGAVHIDIPKCVASSKISLSNYNTLMAINSENTKKYNFPTIFKNINSYDACFSRTLKVINRSKKPIIYLGQGCVDSYGVLREFAIKGNIPVTSTIHGCGIFDEGHNLSLQWCGMHGNATANYSIQEADCIIAIGSRFDDRTTGLIEKYAPKAFEAYENGVGGIIHINLEKTEIKKVIDSHYNFNMSCEKWLTKAIKNIEFNERSDWLTYINDLKKKHKFIYNDQPNKLFMENVLVKLYEKTKHLEDKVIFTNGVGNHQMQTYQYIKSHYPKKILSSGSLGVMGAGLPYGIGAKIANPDKMVIVVDGDSSFNMTCTDMKTIVENDLPVKIAIMNNNAQMMVTIWEKLFFEERYTATINERNPDFTMLAESYGIKAISCDSIEDLEKTLEDFINYPKAILCEFKIEKGICLPLVGPGKALDDMILSEEYNDNIKIDKGMAPS
jgi:acetolactate synthase I/II/III large subunit